MKKVRSSQASISINYYSEFCKIGFFHVSTVKNEREKNKLRKE